MTAYIVDAALLCAAFWIGWWMRDNLQASIEHHRAETRAMANKVRSWPKGPWDRD